MIAESIVVDPEFSALIPPLTTEERDALETSLVAGGCRDALVVWHGHDILLDGHNRLAICRKHGIEYRTASVALPDRASAKVWIIKNQFARRNLTPYQRAELALELEPVIAEQARERQREGGREKAVQKSAQAESKTRDEVAKLAGVSHDTIAKAKVIREKASEETKAALRRGESSINAEHKELKSAERAASRKQELADLSARIASGDSGLPEGVFEIIAVDPPWPYGTEYDPETRRAASPYPEMSLEAIAGLVLPSADDCILWLWTTHAFMRHSFAILDGWGFREVSILTWEKDRIGLGAWLRSQTEFCIMAVKGKPKVLLTNQSTILHGDLRQHSRKPESFYALVDELCIGRKLDFFSREPRKGWAQYGSETEKFAVE